jgi:hypothetical protein
MPKASDHAGQQTTDNSLSPGSIVGNRINFVVDSCARGMVELIQLGRIGRQSKTWRPAFVFPYV